MKNWAGNFEYRASEIARPSSIDELCRIVTSSRRVKALGTRHSFNDSADTDGTLIVLDRLPASIDVDSDALSVRVSAGVTYAQLARHLEARGFALHNLASLPHISVGGAVQTGTHGSGVRNGSLATAVIAIEVVRASGELETLHRGDADFEASVVGIGALGIVTAVLLRIEPTYRVAQYVHEGVPWSSAEENWAAIMGSAYSVSVFTTFVGDATHQIWTKHRIGADTTELDLAALGGIEARTPLHPLPGVSAESVTAQLRSPGPWHERLPHFHSDFVPSHGNEIQSEYLVPAMRAVEAVRAVRSLASVIGPLLYIAEFRMVAADNLWLSPSYARESLAIHFTWQQRQRDVLAILPQIEEVLAPFDARPHWGKVSTTPLQELRRVYPRLEDFAAFARGVDPDGLFHNDFLRRNVFGT